MTPMRRRDDRVHARRSAAIPGLVLAALLAGCAATDGVYYGSSVYVGGGYYDPWYWGPGYYPPPMVGPPPVRPVHPIAPAPPRPTPLPAPAPRPMPMPRPAMR